MVPKFFYLHRFLGAVSNFLYLISNSISRRVFDGRTKRGGQQCNFFIHYEVDDEEVPTVLDLAAYDGEEEGCWVLLQSIV